MKNKIIYLYKIVILFFLPSIPFITLAQDDVQGFIGVINNIIGMIVPLLLAVGLVVFMWGLITYLMKAGDEEGQRGARNLIIYGIIILFVMVSVWGLVNILASTFGGDERRVRAPYVPGYDGGDDWDDWEPAGPGDIFDEPII